MARRIIQFPVRNAFYAQRSYDALARDPQDHAHRIAEQVEQEITRLAFRRSTGLNAEMAATRLGAIVVMPTSSRLGRFKALAARLFTRN